MAEARLCHLTHMRAVGLQDGSQPVLRQDFTEKKGDEQVSENRDETTGQFALCRLARDDHGTARANCGL